MFHHKIQMVDLQTQYSAIQAEMDEAIRSVIAEAHFVGGKQVQQFADELAQYLRVKHLIPCGNGTDALQIALMALGVQRGDEVISVSNSFVATAEAIALLGLRPVWVDNHPSTFTIDVQQIEAAISPRTKAIIPVHLYGQSADMEPILQLAKKYDLYVVEDNAQAIGADYRFADGRIAKTGTMGHIGCTSFYPSKNLGCYGDGGAMFTNDAAIAEKMHQIANHGQKVKYASEMIGINSRLDSLQAAILSVKLRHLDDYNARRQAVARYYDAAFAGVPNITTPYCATYSTHVFHQYTILLPKHRNIVKQKLAQAGIPTMIYYPIPIHQQKAYSQLYKGQMPLPNTEYLAQNSLSLPMHTELDAPMLAYIVEQLLNILGELEW